MANANLVLERVMDVTECPICTEMMVDPKVLPCIHTFCLKCLNQFWNDKQSGEKVPCPVCRTEFFIPAGGLARLQTNFFIEKLIEAQKVSARHLQCDICSTPEIRLNAVKICVDCQQNMCDQCSRVHQMLKGTKLHKVTPIGNCREEKVSSESGDVYCDQHSEKRIEVYCLECKSALCTTCSIVKHSGHKCVDVNDIVEDLEERIRKDIVSANKKDARVVEELLAVEEISRNLKHDFDKSENDILRRGEEIKRIVDEQVRSLLNKLNSEKSAKLKKLNMINEELQVQKMNCESFRVHAEEVLNKPGSAYVARWAGSLKTRAEELRIKANVKAPMKIKVSFVPSDVLNTLISNETNQNIIGSITISELLPTIAKSVAYDRDPKQLASIQFSNLVRGIAALGENIYVIVYDLKVVNVFNSSTFTPGSSIEVPGLTSPFDMVATGNALFVSNEDGRIFHIGLPDRIVTSWTWVGYGLTSSLSINKEGNVIVSNHESNQICEYSPTGELVRVWTSDLVGPYRVAQVDEDRFLVCQIVKNMLHRVCLIDKEGRVMRSFGGAPGSGSANLMYPFRLVVDRKGFILVADHSNSRVVLLNSELEYVKDIIPQSTNMSKIFTLFLDEDNGRLYVSDYNNHKLAVFDFETCI